MRKDPTDRSQSLVRDGESEQPLLYAFWLCYLALTPTFALYIINAEMKRAWNPSYVGGRLYVFFMTGLF